MSGHVVACHQPNFLPWLGFFAKLARSDTFVLLDDVQFTCGHKHNWTSRVRITTANGLVWLSVPVCRSGNGLQRILDIQTNEVDQRWLQKMLKTIERAYCKTPYYKDIVPEICEILSRHKSNISQTNIALIELIVSKLGLKSRLVLSSSLSVQNKSTARLVEITTVLEGDIYLSGDGADDYQVTELFNYAGIKTQKLGFRHPEYTQLKSKTFVPGLSILDAICNVGIDTTRLMLIEEREILRDA